MTHIHRSRLAIILSLSLLALTGCGNQAVDFNNSLAALERKMEAPTKAVKAHFDGYMNTKKFDADRAEADYDALVVVIDQVIAEAKAMKPPGAKLAREFQDGFIAFYNDQRGLVTGEIRQAFDVIKNTTMPDGEKDARLKHIESSMEKKAIESTDKMQNIQARYAAANSMQIEVSK